MAPRKNTKRVEEEAVEAVADVGDASPPKRKRMAGNKGGQEAEDGKVVRLPRAAKNKKPEPEPEPVEVIAKKPPKPKTAKKSEEEPVKKPRGKAAPKKAGSDAEEKEAKPKGKAKKTAEEKSGKAAAGDTAKKPAAKGRAVGKKAAGEEVVEAKPRGRGAKKTAEQEEDSLPPRKTVKGRGKAAAEKSEDQDEEAPKKGKGRRKKADEEGAVEKPAPKRARGKKPVQIPMAPTSEDDDVEEDTPEELENEIAEDGDSATEPEENGNVEELKENGSGGAVQLEEEEPKKGKGRQPPKKGKALKAKFAEADSTDDDTTNVAAVEEMENW